MEKQDLRRKTDEKNQTIKFKSERRNINLKVVNLAGSLRNLTLLKTIDVDPDPD